MWKDYAKALFDPIRLSVASEKALYGQNKVAIHWLLNQPNNTILKVKQLVRKSIGQLREFREKTQKPQTKLPRVFWGAEAILELTELTVAGYLGYWFVKHSTTNQSTNHLEQFAT